MRSITDRPERASKTEFVAIIARDKEEAMLVAMPEIWETDRRKIFKERDHFFP